jgi:hypothetical protein
VALVAELVDALDLKSRGYFMTVPVRVRPGALNEEDFHILFFFGIQSAWILPGQKEHNHRLSCPNRIIMYFVSQLMNSDCVL